MASKKEIRKLCFIAESLPRGRIANAAESNRRAGKRRSMSHRERGRVVYDLGFVEMRVWISG